MRITRSLRVVVVSVSLWIATSANAGTIFEAARFDAKTKKRDLSLRLLVNEQDARVDVLVKGRPLVSLIESGEKLTLINHIARIYVVNDSAQDSMQLVAPVSSRALPSHLFALGSHCPAVEMRSTETVYQVQCSTEADDTEEVEGMENKRTKVGEFLRLAAAIRDPEWLFDRAMTILTLPSAEAKFPYVIRHFESGTMLGELRMLYAVESDIPRQVFEVPRGLRKVTVDLAMSRHATR